MYYVMLEILNVFITEGGKNQCEVLVLILSFKKRI